MIPDLFAPVGAAADMRVPPHLAAGRLKSHDQRLQPRAVKRMQSMWCSNVPWHGCHSPLRGRINFHRSLILILRPDAI